MFSPRAIVALSVAVGAYAAIGPTTNLYIANAIIQPDGFNRSYVHTSNFQAELLADTNFSNLQCRVGWCYSCGRPISRPFNHWVHGSLAVLSRLCTVAHKIFCQGDTFNLNVIDQLNDTTMLTSTSIVGTLLFI